jgi:group I intron endonuclease
MIVYLITNKINGKKYVGQTIWDENRRFKRHVYDAMTGKWDYPLHRAIRKYGKDSFDIKILVRCINLEELNRREELCIGLFKTLAPDHYNLHTGGNSHVTSEESKKKMSESRKGGKHTPETIDKMRVSQKGRTFTPETKAQMSKSHTGKILTQEHKDNISKVNKGKLLSKEHVDKIRSANTKINNKSEKERPKSKRPIEHMMAAREARRRPIFVPELNKIFDSISDVVKELGISKVSVHEVLSGKAVSRRGYSFSYAKEGNK